MRYYLVILWVALLVLTASISPGEETTDPWESAHAATSHVEGKKLIRIASETVSRLLGTTGALESLTVANLPARVKQWQHRGIDGLVMSIASHDKSKGQTNMAGQWWNLVRRDYEEFIPEIEVLQSVEDWGRVTDRFLWSSYAIWGDLGPDLKGPRPQCQDWFNDAHWEIILSNVRLQTRIAKECGFKGILLDIEQYDHNGQGAWRIPFDYPGYAASGYKLAGEAAPRSLEECQAKLFQRARQYAQAICEVYPGLTLFLIPEFYRRDGLRPDEVLLPPFIDGLVVGLDEEARLVVGTEYTYLDSEYRNMLVIREGVIQQRLAMSKYPELVREKLRIAVGVWADSGHGQREDRYSDTDASVNQRDPQRHKHAVHNALAASDKYAWIYGQESFFLTPEPTPLMREYFQANVDGHEPQDLWWKPVPKWDMINYDEHDKSMAELDARFWSTIDSRGYKIVFEFPDYWHFFIDTEQRGRSIFQVYDHDAWPLISTLKCWQSQSTKAVGEGVYRIYFDAPADLNRQTDQIFLAFGGFRPDDRPDYWTVARLNGKSFQIDNLIDVSEWIKPGQSNFLAVEVINKAGPGGPLGHVKLLVRGRE